MSKSIKVSAIIPIAIVLVAFLAMIGMATGDTNMSSMSMATSTATASATSAHSFVYAGAVGVTSGMYPYGGSVPPWVDSHAMINKVPTAVVNATLWSSPQKNTYNDNLPPWIDYNIQVPGPSLSIFGNVGNPMNLTVSQLREIGVYHENITLNAHGKISYIDADVISLNALLQKASPNSGATKVVFTGIDGYSATLALTNVTENQGDVIAFTQTQGLRNCMPKNAASYWVQNLVSIKVV